MAVNSRIGCFISKVMVACTGGAQSKVLALSDRDQIMTILYIIVTFELDHLKEELAWAAGYQYYNVI